MTEFGYNFAALRGAGIPNAMLRRLKKPVLTVLKWQVAATVALALLGALFAGGHGAASAVVGGLIVSQLLTLYLTPVVYLYLESFVNWVRKRSIRTQPTPSSSPAPAAVS